MSDLDRLRAMNAAVRRRDSLLHQELAEKSAQRADAERPGFEGMADEFGAESIVLRQGRPVLAIKRDQAELVLEEADTVTWRDRLTAASAHITRAARSVGRVEVEGHSLAWLGTGWLIAPDTIITNRHVAGEFGRDTGTTFVFREGLGGTAMVASIDLLEEIDRGESLAFQLTEILYIEDTNGPDLAFLRVEQIAGDNPPVPIRLSETSQPDELVAVIGYPARDSRIPDADLMDEIFGNVYDKKRLAPGQLMEPREGTLVHDCSTLGGNSGSVLLSLDTGEAVGLHFAGRFLQGNLAVPSQVVAQRLDDLRSGRPMRQPMIEAGAAPLASPSAPSVAGASSTMSFLVPLTVTVQLGDPTVAGAPGVTVAAGSSGARMEETGETFVETRVEDYLDRTGYDPAFLGDGFAVPLPVVTADLDDVLTFEFAGERQQVLKYEHFSVQMGTRRKLLRWSAVNIDGTTEIENLGRPGWRNDPRIPTDAQIRDAPYGNSPKFARGHMTRREYPNWGTQEIAERANADTMHVTNVAPQMQTFNGGVWLQLEGYALQNARKSDVKICVATGPIFAEEDPVKYGVTIPVEFWKVIAFIHDDTGKLSATGYTMSQLSHLKDEEFVFGAHDTAQRTISSIEARTGLSFGPLAALDPFVEPEGVEPPVLTDVSQIKLV
ncbi:DNA/RNA non-specific endonuclease [Nocardioides ungokensis]|uniref:DNA/RNA non-specific endonuclease n=1 Tax=Nocardioides ungokensis TaxID=1643322 RepID=UPI0015DF5BC1|nr:DNA/RNA non-specific endonuclease [Nocardioides ungokensis]